LYFNTTDDTMKVYEGSVWVAAYASLSGALLSQNNLSDVADIAASRTNLGLVIGTNVQAFSAILQNTTASYTTAEETKLAGIEAGADVTDTANVVAALTAGSNINIAANGTISGAAQYTHPSHPGDDINIDTGALSGATVISDLDFNITTDTLGHVTDANAAISTRTLTLANLGYTGATNANYITNNNQLTNGAGYTTYTANQSLNTNSTPSFTGVNINGAVDFGDWTITESGGSLYFATGGTNKMKLDASGNLDVVGNVNSNATIT